MCLCVWVRVCVRTWPNYSAWFKIYNGTQLLTVTKCLPNRLPRQTPSRKSTSNKIDNNWQLVARPSSFFFLRLLLLTEAGNAPQIAKFDLTRLVFHCRRWQINFILFYSILFYAIFTLSSYSFAGNWQQFSLHFSHFLWLCVDYNKCEFPLAISVQCDCEFSYAFALWSASKLGLSRVRAWSGLIF